MDAADFTESQDWREYQQWKATQGNTQFIPRASPSTPVQRPSNIPRPANNSETTNIPDTQGSTPSEQMSINDLLMTSGRQDMAELNPKRPGKTTWFKYDPKITKSVLQQIKSDLRIFCPKYKSLPEEIKQCWFKSFAQEFNWNPTYTQLMRRDYDKVAKKVYSSQVYGWKNKWKKGKKQPEWIISNSVWNEYIQHWKETEVEITAENNKTNRNSPREGDGPAKHNTGAKSYERCFEEMTQEAGRPPNMVEFMVDTHTNKKTKEIIDKKVERIIQSVREKEQYMLSQETQDGSERPQLSNLDINNLCLQEMEVSKSCLYTLVILLLTYLTQIWKNNCRLHITRLKKWGRFKLSRQKTLSILRM